jgi:hypothetical protein
MVVMVITLGVNKRRQAERGEGPTNDALHRIASAWCAAESGDEIVKLFGIHVYSPLFWATMRLERPMPTRVYDDTAHTRENLTPPDVSRSWCECASSDCGGPPAPSTDR